ncbi:DUF1493 family protein [Paraburkholderia sp. Ac-20336]|uniref:DUF1493 family protein n=1 Tax=Paraburkholderia sp. Ac-20336 TaxID=2703886 RepID=UPI00197EE242|nr:DUF1493 family protein [Paraburkholderia sp. Ac-20336]MBN3806270.1 DUF1493 family protein [Paraburkholderia sp. Ac-20336]
MANDPQWDALLAFTREEVGAPWWGKAITLTLSTSINDDLGIDRDDAVEFMQKFFDRFNVAGMENFPLHRYFGPEGNALLALLLVPMLVVAFVSFVLRRKPGNLLPRKPTLTLGMLLDAIRVGRWDTKAIERARKPRI